MSKTTQRIPWTHIRHIGETLTRSYADFEKVGALLIHARGMRSIPAQRSMRVLKAIDELRESLMRNATEWTGSEDKAVHLLYGRDVRPVVEVDEDRDATTNDFSGGSPPEDK